MSKPKAFYTTLLARPQFLNQAGEKMPNTGGWQERHTAALRAPTYAEEGILSILRGWLQYADRHRLQFESGIGEDYVLGPHWADIGRGIRGLLNGELGRLDGGTLDGLIFDVLGSEDMDPGA